MFIVLFAFGAGLAGWVLGVSRIQRSDSYSVAVRGSLADVHLFQRKTLS
jgi:hypothetical protein